MMGKGAFGMCVLDGGVVVALAVGQIRAALGFQAGRIGLGNKSGLPSRTRRLVTRQAERTSLPRRVVAVARSRDTNAARRARAR